MLTDYFKHISHIPHFYMIRLIETKLLSEYIDKTESPFLDLGCGDGSFTKSLELKDVYGIDVDEKAIEGMVNNDHYIKVILASASELPFPEGFFGTVFSNCSLEHMDNLKKVLIEVRRVLKGNGKFIFTVPSSGFIDVIKKDKILGDAGLNHDAILNEYNEFHHH